MGADLKEITIPFLSKVVMLPRLKGQDETKQYAVVSGFLPEPDRGHGYVVQLLGHRRALCLAWLSASGNIFAADVPTDKEPRKNPVLSLAREADIDHQGAVLLPQDEEENPLIKVAQVHYDDLNQWSMDNTCLDFGSEFAEKSFDLAAFLGLCYIAFVEKPFEGQQEAEDRAQTHVRSMDDVLDNLFQGQFADALEMLMYRVDADTTGHETTGYERYAAHILKQAGAHRVRGICALTEVQVFPLVATGLAWIRFGADDLSAQDRATLLSIEAALNRLCLIRSYIAQVDPLATQGYSFEKCAQVDWHVCMDITHNIADLFNATTSKNAQAEIYGTACKRNGEWDARTRMADSCEHLQLPFRFDYRFNCNIDQAEMHIRMGLPLSSMLCQQRYDQETSQLEDLSAFSSELIFAYAMRQTALVAAAGFGSSLNISRVIVDGCLESSSGETLFSLAFDRIPFKIKTLPAFSLEALESIDSLHDWKALFEALAPSQASLEVTEHAAFMPCLPLEDHVGVFSSKIADSTRELPKELQEAFRARTVAELDIYLDDEQDALIQKVQKLAPLVEEDPQQACELLEDCLAISDMMCMDYEHPLYCSTVHGRMFAGDTNAAQGVDFFTKLPDSAFLTRFYLAHCYVAIGELDRAYELALRCCELAPSSRDGYMLLVGILSRQARWDDMIATIKHAMKFEISTDHVFYLFYRLAFAFANLGQADVAIAAYRIASLQAELKEQAEEEMHDVMSHVGMQAPPTVEECEACLRAHHVSVEPNPRLVELIALAAIRFCDMGELAAAHYATYVLATTTRSDILHSAAASMLSQLEDIE